MKRRWLPALLLAFLLPSVISCYRRSGFSFYPQTPYFAPTDPGRVELLRREPRRDHIKLGEVWIRPDWDWDRFYVEEVLREKAARMGADALVIVADNRFRDAVVYSYWRGPRRVYDRETVGIAIRYRR
jgi:hypothetical protein